MWQPFDLRASARLLVRGCFALVFLHGLSAAQICSTTRASVDSSGVEGDRACGLTALSADGRFVAFTSSSTNLDVNDTNLTDDVFVHDRVTGVTERVSVATGGGEGDASSSYPSLSADARYVCFSSWASTLVPGDTNGTNDVFLRDRLLGTTERVSVDDSGAQGNGGSYLGVLTPDARYVVFFSFASNFAPADTNDARDVFVRDLVLGTTERVSVDSSGVEGNAFSGGSAGGPGISADGRFVCFASSADNLVAGDTNGFDDVFLRDRVSSTTTRLSIGVGGAQPDEAVNTSSMTWDGRWVGAVSAASNLVPNDTNADSDAFVIDCTTGAIERVSVDSSGIEAVIGSWVPVLSADGRFVAFTSAAPNLVPFDTNDKRDVFLRDRLAGTTERVSVSDTFAPSNEDCNGLSISADSSAIAFTSAAAFLVPNDTNATSDTFVRECHAASGFCFGTSSACPCGNGGAWNSGCANSLTSGAILTTQGLGSVSADSLTLVVSGLPPAAPVVFLQGGTQLGGGLGVPFGDGLRCVGAPTVRLGQRYASGGIARYGAGADPQLSVQGQVPAGGDYRHYQVWYRNSAAFCTSGTFNLSNGATVLWTP